MDDTKYDELLNKIKQSEKKSIANIIKYSVFSILGALLLISFSIYQYIEIRSKLAKAKGDLKEVNLKLINIQKDLEKEKRKLKKTLDLSKFAYNLQPVDEKRIYSHIYDEYSEEASRIFGMIIELRHSNVRWQLGGTSISAGFDSPNFAVFVLKELRIHIGALNEIDNVTSRKVLDNLKPIDRPSVGDLVIYEGGFVMFYFENWRDEGFVIGMTPSGISALKYDFGTIVGLRRVKNY